jgi:hypothetical protein
LLHIIGAIGHIAFQCNKSIAILYLPTIYR